ncbi:MAG: hypothetical protein Q8934_09855 [Bacillota bacterium]|nr:hypothetical protein [Bacillota bacterium]
MEKVTFSIQVGEGEEIKFVSNGALLSRFGSDQHEKELNSEFFGELDDDSLLLSGLGAFICAVDEIKKRHQDVNEEELLEEIANKSASILQNLNYSNLIEKVSEAIEESEDESMDDTSPIGGNLLANLFGFGSGEDEDEEEQQQQPSVLQENVALSPLMESEDDEKPDSHLKVITSFKKNNGQPPEIQSSLEGYGQIQDIIEIGCANYTYSLNYANMKWFEMVPNSNPMLVQLQTSQKAAELLMKYQLGDAGELMGQMLPELFSSFFGNNDDSEKE